MPAIATRPRARHAATPDLAPLYKARADRPVLIKVPALKYLMVDGTGSPGTSPEFQHAIEALFTLAYGLRFGLKKEGDRRPFPSLHLEGLFWVPGKEGCALTDPDMPTGAMRWTLMIAVPSFVTARMVDRTRTEAARKEARPALGSVRLERLAEGAAAQVLHVGPYDAEGPTIERLFAFIAAAGGAPRGKHHEIYLNDPRRVGPAKTKTIVRQPITPL